MPFAPPPVDPTPAPAAVPIFHQAQLNEAALRVSGDFNGDGADDVGFFYNYGGGNAGLWTFNGRGLNSPVPKWFSCAGCTSWERTKPA